MAAWHGRQSESPSATFAVIAGSPKLSTPKIVRRRTADLCCGIKEAWTAGHGKRGSRLGAAANCDSGEALKNPDQKTAAYSERVFMPGPELIFVARFEIPAKSVLF